MSALVQCVYTFACIGVGIILGVLINECSHGRMA